MHMDDNFTAMGELCNCLLGALPWTLRCTIDSLVRSKGYLPRTKDLTRQPVVGDPQQKKQKRYIGCLAHVVSGMFYSVVAYRRQPNL